MKTSQTIVVGLILVIISIYVHELGHLASGIMLGYTPIAISVDLLRLSGLTIFEATNVHWIVYASGGLAQAVFFLASSKIVFETRYVAVIMVGYAVLETIAGVYA